MNIRRFFNYQELPDGTKLQGRFNEEGRRVILQAIEKLNALGPKVFSNEELELLVVYSIEAANQAREENLSYTLTQQVYDTWFFRNIPEKCVCSYPLYFGGPERVRLPNYSCRYHYPQE